MSASLSSSLDMLSLSHVSNTRWASDSTSDDEDEIVWSLSSSAVLSSSSPLISPLSETADYVLIPRMETSAPNTLATVTTPATATATSQEPLAPVSLPSALTPDGIAQDMAALSLSTAPSSQLRHDNDGNVQQPTTASATASASSTKKAHPEPASANNRGSASANAGPPSVRVAATTPTNRKKVRTANASSSSSSSSSDVPKSKSKSKKGRRAKKGGASESASSTAPARERQMGLGLRAVVDDSSVSEVSGEEISSSAGTASAAADDGYYHEAQKFMTS